MRNKTCMLRSEFNHFGDPCGSLSLAGSTSSNLQVLHSTPQSFGGDASRYSRLQPMNDAAIIYYAPTGKLVFAVSIVVWVNNVNSATIIPT